MSSLERNRSILHKYIPEQAVSLIADWIFHFDFKLKIKKGRSSKLGDYRPPLKRSNHLITINKNLNKYAFLITLIHEIAHLTNWNKHKDKVKPHGQEWKREFKLLMNEFSGKDIFPEDVSLALNKYLQDPAASSCSDVHLSRVLKRYDQKEGVLLLEQLPVKTVFKFNGGDFVKGERVRTRYKCLQLKTRRQYLFSPIAEVQIAEASSGNNNEHTEKPTHILR